MWLPKNQSERKSGVSGIVAVAIDKDKGSQNALKWAIDNILLRGTTVVLIHVKVKSSYSAPSLLTPRAGFDDNSLVCKEPDASTRDIFLPFRVFCTRKDIQCKDVVLEDVDVARALTEYASQTAIEHLVLGSTAKTGLLRRFKVVDIPGTVSKGAPDFCTVYIIAKGKIQSMRSASRPAPSTATMKSPLNQPSSRSELSQFSDPNIPLANGGRALDRRSIDGRSHEATPPRRSNEEADFFRSPFTRKGYAGKPYGEISSPDTDISFVSSGRPSTDRMFPSLYDDAGMLHCNPRLSYSSDTGMGHSNPRLSHSSDIDNNYSFESMQYGRRSLDMASPPEFPSILHDSFERNSCSSSSQTMDEVEAEMRRLKLELKQTMEMYSTACKEALTAKQKAVELQRWKFEEERRLEEAKLKEEAALAIAEKEKARSTAAMETAEAQKRIAELEAHKRLNAEMKALRESEEKKKAIDALGSGDFRYRRYSIEEIETATEFFKESLKIGEGGYGPVFKCFLDHTPVAVKVLRPDAAQGRSQFNREVEVLSCIRHPNMVLLLGACPEYGCLVYEYMANGSLDDRLFRRGNTPPLSWQLRFKIAAEIGTGLLFLHQTKPEPLVHRDLKPGNILLDRNFVSKISDVGLARLVPPSVADTVTQYRMTSTAGTFCYIDPEYQQTGMLGVKSDVYSLGIIFLQILTARPPMGLTHHVERAIENGAFAEMLDPTVPDWPVEDALILANMALKCAELRRKDRPDLGKEVLPQLNRLRTMAEDNQPYGMFGGGYRSPSSESQVSFQPDDIPHSGDSTRVTSSPV